MKVELLTLYKVTWCNTAATYVVAKPYADVDEIKRLVKENEERCDHITCVEKVSLPEAEYVRLFLRDPLAL